MPSFADIYGRPTPSSVEEGWIEKTKGMWEKALVGEEERETAIGM